MDSYGEGFDNIGLEDYEGGYEMTSYLIGQGHRKIAFLGISNIQWEVVCIDFAGLQDAMEEHKLEFDKKMIIFIFLNMIITDTKCCGSLHKNEGKRVHGGVFYLGFSGK